VSAKLEPALSGAGYFFRGKQAMTAEEFMKAIKSLARGETMVYYVGNLCSAIEKDWRVHQLQRIALTYGTGKGELIRRNGTKQGAGQIYLTQQRVAEGFEYRATKR